MGGGGRKGEVRVYISIILFKGSGNGGVYFGDFVESIILYFYKGSLLYNVSFENLMEVRERKGIVLHIS